VNTRNPNKQQHIRPQAGWTRRFAPRLCAGRYVVYSLKGIIVNKAPFYAKKN